MNMIGCYCLHSGDLTSQNEVCCKHLEPISQYKHDISPMLELLLCLISVSLGQCIPATLIVLSQRMTSEVTAGRAEQMWL